MIQDSIYISTTWAASTSFIPFDRGMRNAQNYAYQSTANRGIYATTAYVQGVWESQKFEEDFKDYLGNSATRMMHSRAYIQDVEHMNGMNGPYADAGNAFSPGTVIEAKVRKLKALKASPNRSGVQVNRQLVKGNKLIFKYIGVGELVRPL